MKNTVTLGMALATALTASSAAVATTVFETFETDVLAPCEFGEHVVECSYSDDIQIGHCSCFRPPCGCDFSPYPWEECGYDLLCEYDLLGGHQVP